MVLNLALYCENGDEEQAKAKGYVDFSQPNISKIKQENTLSVCQYFLWASDIYFKLLSLHNFKVQSVLFIN